MKVPGGNLIGGKINQWKTTQHALNIRCLCQLVDHLCNYIGKISEVEFREKLMEKTFRTKISTYHMMLGNTEMHLFAEITFMIHERIPL